MKNTFMVIPLVLLLFFTVGCLQRGEVADEPVPDVEADIQAIKDVVADFNVALNTSDLDKASSHHLDDVVVIPPNRSPLIGKDASLIDLQQLFDKFTVQEVDVVEDVQVSGELAVAHYTWSAVVTPKAGGKPLEENGNGIMVLKKQPEGIWKFTYLIWSNESLVLPIQAE